jgi:hypothetical protein
MAGRTRIVGWLVLLAGLCFSSIGRAAECHATSGATTTPLYELYTSEGCDSCPPADRWFASRFPAQPQGAAPIALAFHVDYWDRLGWKDRFASAAYTARQYDAMAANGATFVYTPQVLLQGKPLTRWQGLDPVAHAANVAAKPARARVDVDARLDGSQVKATVVVANLADRDARLFVAYTDNALSSQVTAGENRGVRLDHDHVVRTLQPSVTVPAGATRRAEVALAVPTERGKLASVVAFVQDPAHGDVLQAVALPLSACPEGR